MKRQALYKLSKTGLYFICNDLFSSGMSEDELAKIQFFDEIPSQIFWESFISESEKNIRNFEQDLILLRRSEFYCNTHDAKKSLTLLFAEEKMVMLFYDIHHCILFPINILDKILDSCHYFYNEDYLLFGMSHHKVITSGNGHFLEWKITQCPTN